MLQVVQKELKERAIESSTTTLEPSNGNNSKDINRYSKDWVHFDDSENFHPNLFAKGIDHASKGGGGSRDCYVNPFL